MNGNFGKLDEHGYLENAPDMVRLDGHTILHPTAVEYARLGYLPVVDSRPSDPAPSGYHWASRGWEETGGEIRLVWEVEKDPPPTPREFSKFALEIELFKRGLLDQADAFIDSQVLTNEKGETMPLRRAYNTALTFKEDNQYFASFLGAAKDALGISDVTVAAILDACVAG